MYRRLFTILILILGFSTAHSQMSHSLRGVTLSYYDQEVHSLSLEKNYLYRSYSLSILQKKKLIALPVIALTFDFQTQLGITQVANQRNEEFIEKGIEVAILPGLNIEFSLLPDFWWIYIGGSVGPQFTSNTPSRQKSGFIFSDSAYVGSRFKISENKQFDLRLGLRHQSNAGISEPNGGIETIFAAVGILVNY